MKKVKIILTTLIFVAGLFTIIGSSSWLDNVPSYEETDMYKNRDSYNTPNTYRDYQPAPRKYNDDDECDHSGPGECVKQL